MAAGKANIVDVVTAVAETEVAIDALVSVRDRVIHGLRRNHEDADLTPVMAAKRPVRHANASMPSSPSQRGMTGERTMTGPEVLDVARDAILTLVLVSSPLMLVGLAVGVAISLFQALTQIQEMTLVFVPKILAIFVAMLIALPFMAERCRATWRGSPSASSAVSASARRTGRRMQIDVSFLPALAAAFMLCLRAHRHDDHAAAGARRAQRVRRGCGSPSRWCSPR